MTLSLWCLAPAGVQQMEMYTIASGIRTFCVVSRILWKDFLFEIQQAIYGTDVSSVDKNGSIVSSSGL